jgi:hypothetical protein
MKRVSSGGDLRTKAGPAKRPHEAAANTIMTNMVKEAANLVVSSSAIIANHDMRSVVAIGAAVSVSRARILVSLVSSMDEDMPSKGGEKEGGSFATWRPATET